MALSGTESTNRRSIHKAPKRLKIASRGLETRRSRNHVPLKSVKLNAGEPHRQQRAGGSQQQTLSKRSFRRFKHIGSWYESSKARHTAYLSSAETTIFTARKLKLTCMFRTNDKRPLTAWWPEFRSDHYRFARFEDGDFYIKPTKGCRAETRISVQKRVQLLAL